MKIEQHRQRILVAEDEKPLANVLVLKLRSVGYEVETVGDGQAALDALAERPDYFDLLLLDLVMPNKDGFEVLQSLKQRGVSLPVIVSSNLSQSIDQERTKALGAQDYFIKSDTSIGEVVEHVARVLKANA